eukprot:3160201-Rhodomonas_salina.1
MPAGSAQTLAQTRTRGSERKSQIELKHRTAWAPTDSAHTSYHICLRTHYAEPGTDIPTREGIGRYARSSTNSTAELLTVLPRWYRPAPRHYWTACGRVYGTGRTIGVGTWALLPRLLLSTPPPPPEERGGAGRGERWREVEGG